VYHVDALQMASVIKEQGGQLPLGELFFCYFVFHLTRPWFLKCQISSPNFLALFCMKNFDGVIWHFKNQEHVHPKTNTSSYVYSGDV
jgi:hypothetical protein